MKTDETTETETAVETTEATEAPAPRKMLLSKRVLRHFSVRSGLQAGATADDTVCAICLRPYSRYCA